MRAVEKEHQKVIQEKQLALRNIESARQMLQCRKIFPGVSALSMYVTPQTLIDESRIPLQETKGENDKSEHGGWKKLEKEKEEDLQGWAKLFPGAPHNTKSELKNKEPSFVILKSNLLFEFRDEKV